MSRSNPRASERSGSDCDAAPAELDEWVAGLESLLDAFGGPAADEAPPARVWAAIERRIASTSQDPR